MQEQAWHRYGVDPTTLVARVRTITGRDQPFFGTFATNRMEVDSSSICSQGRR